MQFFSVPRLLSVGRSVFDRLSLKAGPPVPVRSGGFMGMVREPFAGAWQRNVTSDSRESLLAFAAVYACVGRIASDIAKLRIRLVEQQPDGTWPEVDRMSPFWPVLRKPNKFQNRIQFLTSWIVSKLLRGNTYILKQRDQRGVVTALYVLDPNRVVPLVTPEGDVYYQINADPLSGLVDLITVPASEIIHDRGLTLFHPLIGVSPIYACGSSATQGNRIQAQTTAFFENMARPSGMLTAPAQIDEVTALRLKAEWQAAYGGGNIGKLFVGGSGLSYAPMAIAATDSQLIEQLRWTVEDVGRAFGVPLYKISAGEMPKGYTIEQLEQEYYSGCLQILIESMELALDEGLGIGEANNSLLGTELDLDGLMRMDTAAKYDSIGKAIGGGWMMPNEGRAKANLPPVEGGDTPYLQEQNWPLRLLAGRELPTRPPTPPADAGPAPAPPAAAQPDAAAASKEMTKALDAMKRGFADVVV